MKIAVNGTADQFPETTSIKDILAARDLGDETVIVLLNGEMTNRDAWAGIRLKPEDKIEIVRVVGGG